MLPSERWALTPPFHPYRNAHANRRRLAGLPASCHRAAPSGGLSFCGTIREQQRKLSPVLPLPWRYQARCPFLPAPTLRLALRRWCPDFPPACDCRELPRVSASQRSPGSPANSIISVVAATFGGLRPVAQAFPPVRRVGPSPASKFAARNRAANTGARYSNFSNSISVRTGTFNSRALSSFEPASAPTTT
jgi:hypothetical protein